MKVIMSECCKVPLVWGYSAADDAGGWECSKCGKPPTIFHRIFTLLKFW
jgi:hypothetical protein